jgi:hypothetical protein
MKPTAVFAPILTLALSATATPVKALDKRVSWPCGGTGPCPVVISEFTLFGTTNNCAATDVTGSYTFYKGYDSDICHLVSELIGGAPAFGVSETDGDKKCRCEFSRLRSVASVVRRCIARRIDGLEEFVC